MKCDQYHNRPTSGWKYQRPYCGSDGPQQKRGEIPLIWEAILGVVNVGVLTIGLTNAQTEILMNEIHSNKNMK